MRSQEHMSAQADHAHESAAQAAAAQAPRTEPWLQEIMIDESPFMSLVFDADLRVLACNEEAVRFFEFGSKAALCESFLPMLEKSIPAFQPDASPTIPLSTRFDYVVANGALEFELELTLPGRRVPLRFTMKKLPRGESYLIVCYILDMQQLKEARNELLRQDFLMRQVNRVATRLMSATPEKFDAVVVRMLKSLAQGLGASQLAIWENYEQADGAVGCREVFLWNGDKTQKAADAARRQMSYAAMEDWYQTLAANKRISTQDREHLRDRAIVPRGTRSLLLIPIFLQETFWGVVAAAKGSDDKPFTDIEEKAAQSSGILIVAAYLRNQINQNLIVAREQAMAGGKAKSDFLSRMSHEIRTPMNAILGMTAIARKTTDMERMQYSLEKIEVASEQLLSLINDILDMSKIEAGKLEITDVPFDFRQMLQNIIDMMRVRLEEKDQHLHWEIEGAFDRFMLSDELRISQLMINLLTNAIKFTDPGGKIAIRVRDFADPHGTAEERILHVEVQDNGIGISPEQQARLFRSFEQADGGITRRFGGTGLGLAICKSISQLLGGDIWLESREGEGTTFFFELRFRWGEPLTVPEAHAEAAEACGDCRWPGKRVLLVEDIAINREIMLALLEDTELQITTAENGLEAVAAVEQNPQGFDIILMDVQMPLMDGFDATRTIRKMGGLAATVPILAMTANAFSDDVARCLDAGMNDHVAKPVDFDVLMKKLKYYFDLPQAPQEN